MPKVSVTRFAGAVGITSRFEQIGRATVMSAWQQQRLHGPATQDLALTAVQKARESFRPLAIDAFRPKLPGVILNTQQWFAGVSDRVAALADADQDFDSELVLSERSWSIGRLSVDEWIRVFLTCGLLYLLIAAGFNEVGAGQRAQGLAHLGEAFVGIATYIATSGR